MNLHNQAILVESIIHLEDLPVSQFVRAIETLKDKTVTEKLDGANLWFGHDDRGFFTSREGKGGNRFYSVDDWKMVANYNGFRAAHAALESVDRIIEKYLKPNDVVEAEILFGRQPNTVVYGSEDKNFIVILRGIGETGEKAVNDLAEALEGKNIKAEATIISSDDGENLKHDDIVLHWQFTSVKPIETRKIDTVEAMSILDKLKKFLAAKNSDFPEYTNLQIAEIKLNQVPTGKRSDLKAARDVVLETILTDYKLPIKEHLLDVFVRKLKPFLQASSLHPSEDIGVEGVVVTEPGSDDMIKIVDRDVFTAINAFNSTTRNLISGLVKTADQDMPVESRGGVFGEAKIKIADILGMKELALSSGTKRILKKFYVPGDIDKTVNDFAKSLNIQNLQSVKKQIIDVLDSSLDEINMILNSFKKSAGEFVLTLKTGKQIGLAPEVMSKTLTAFAETRAEIQKIKKDINNCDSTPELVNILYGRTLQSLLDGEQMSESFSLIKSVSEDGEAGVTGAAAVAATTAGDIAPPERRLFGDKIVLRRERKFIKPKKFPMPLIMQAEAKRKRVKEDVDQDNAGNVNDNAAANRDVEFKQLRNNIKFGSELTPLDVHRYLTKAHEINNAVDTVAFGVETSDNNIVKVYVNHEQADEFERAMADALSMDADIEEAINDLSNKFDIVDVEWPEEAVVEPEPETVEIEDKDEINLSPEKEDDSTNTKTAGNSLLKLVSSLSKNEEDTAEHKSPVGEDTQVQEPTKSSLEALAMSLTSEEKNPEGESMKTLGEMMANKILASASIKEAKEPAAADSSEESGVLKGFNTLGEKSIIKLMLKLGIPEQTIRQRKADFKASIDSAADEFMKNSAMKMWTKKLLDLELPVAEATGFDAKLSSKYQHLIYQVLKKLGLPASAERKGTELVKSIRNVAKQATENNAFRIYLSALAKQLGVGHDLESMSEPVKESVQLNEDAQEAMDMVVDFLTAMNIMGPSAGAVSAVVDRQLKKPHVMSMIKSLATDSVAQAKLRDVSARMHKKPQSGETAPGDEEKK